MTSADARVRRRRVRVALGARGTTCGPAPLHRPVHTAIARALFLRVGAAARGAGRAARRPHGSVAAGPTRRSCASAATPSSAGSAPTA